MFTIHELEHFELRSVARGHLVTEKHPSKGCFSYLQINQVVTRLLFSTLLTKLYSHQQL